MPISNSLLATNWFGPIAAALPLVVALAVPPSQESVSQGPVAEFVSTYKQSDVVGRVALSVIPYAIGVAGLVGISATRRRFWQGGNAVDALMKHTEAYSYNNVRFHIRDGVPLTTNKEVEDARYAITCLKECMAILEKQNLTQVEEVCSTSFLVKPKEIYGECQAWIPVLEKQIKTFEQQRALDLNPELSDQQELARCYDLFGLAKGVKHSLERLQASFQILAGKTLRSQLDLSVAQKSLAELRIAFAAVCRDQGYVPSYGNLSDQEAKKILFS